MSRPLKENFFDEPAIGGAMVRRGWGPIQELELAYLKSNTNLLTKIRSEMKESRVGGPYLECEELGLSSSTVGHLFYLNRIEELREGRPAPSSVVEVGGGYGNFGRLLYGYSSRPPTTYTIVDLPEFCMVQYLFLKMTEPDWPIQLVTHPSEGLSDRGIRLVPITAALGSRQVIKANLFTSHFALTEAGQAVRRHVYESKFFAADEIYYVGQQAARWGVDVDAEIEKALGNEWRRKAAPFHMPNCIELYATRAD